MTNEENILKTNGGYELTAGKKQAIHKQLSNIQNNIMKVFLSNPNRAKELMERYTNLTKEFDSSKEVSMELINKIIDLESETMRDVKESSSKESVKAFGNKCDELLKLLNEDTIEQIEEELKKLHLSFENKMCDLSLQEINEIENMLTNIKFFIIRQKVKTSNWEFDLRSEIPQNDKEKMEAMFSYKIIDLLESSNQRQQEAGKDLKDKITLLNNLKGKSPVYNWAIWQQFAQIDMLPQEKSSVKAKGRKSLEKNKENNSLEITTWKPSLWQRIINKIKGLRKTEIEKIAMQAVTQDMLDKYMDFSLPEGSRYELDMKLPVYDFLSEMKKDENSKYMVEEKESWNFIDDEGKEFTIEVITRNERTIAFGVDVLLHNIDSRKTIKRVMYGGGFCEEPTNIIKFARFLGMEEQVKNVIANYCINAKNHENTSVINERTPKLLAKLSKSLSLAMEEYEQTQFEFYGQEAMRKKKIEGEKGKDSEHKEFAKSIKVSPTREQAKDVQQGKRRTK